MFKLPVGHLCLFLFIFLFIPFTLLVSKIHVYFRCPRKILFDKLRREFMGTKKNGKNYIHKIDVDDAIIRRRRQDISLHKENGTHVKLLH